MTIVNVNYLLREIATLLNLLLNFTVVLLTPEVSLVETVVRTICLATCWLM